MGSTSGCFINDGPAIGVGEHGAESSETADRAVARAAMAQAAVSRCLMPGIGPSLGPAWPERVVISEAARRGMLESAGGRGAVYHMG